MDDQMAAKPPTDYDHIPFEIQTKTVITRLIQRVRDLEARVSQLENTPAPALERPQPDERPTTIRPQTTSFAPLFLPELDYLIWLTKLRGEFRVGTKVGGRAHYKTPLPTQNAPNILYGYNITDLDIEPPEHTYTVPSPTLRRDLTFLYGVSYKDDFRYLRTSTEYAGGVTSGEEIITKSTSCAVFRTKELTDEELETIIRNTKQQWNAQSEEAKRIRIVDDEGMEEILKQLASRTATPGQITWSMIEPRDLTSKEEDNWHYLQPRRIKMAW